MSDPGHPDEPSSTPKPASSPGPAAGDAPHLTRGFLFADLRDYTHYVDEHGDHAGAALLERYRTLVRGAVAAAHGAEIKTEGDSFYVVFDSASAAVRCGQEIIASADAADPGEPIRVGVGVHAGETVETAEGYVGSAVNIAARLCAQAKAGELVVSETVRALTRTYLEVEFEPLGARHLKGVNEQIAIYRVVPKGAPSRGSRARRAGAGRRRWLVAALALGGVLGLGAVGTAVMLGSPVPTVRPSGAPSAPASASEIAPASASPSPGLGDGTADEQALKARIPLDFQPYCGRSSQPQGSLGGDVSLQCALQPGRPGYGADTVWYDQFRSGSLMETAVNGVRAGQHLAAGDAVSNCTTSFPGIIGTWSLGFTFNGVLACYTRDGAAWVLWTYKGDNIAVRAVRHDGDTATLYAWWHDIASPFLR